MRYGGSSGGGDNLAPRCGGGRIGRGSFHGHWIGNQGLISVTKQNNLV